MTGTKGLAAALITLALNLVLVVHYHDQSLWPADDGTYAHVADRLLRGEVLSRDIKEDHAGASHFLHAAAFALFGTDLVSLRYPLMAVTFVHSVVVLVLLWPAGPLAAVAGSIASVALGVVQFLNPQPHWYCLFIVGLIAVLLERRQASPARADVAVGVLLGLCYLFRQLTAAFVGVGVAVWMLAGIAHAGPPTGRGTTRAVLALLGLGLGWYVTQKDPLALMLIGMWPLLIVALGIRRSRSDAFPWTPFLRVMAGALLPLVPVLAYHAVNGSVGAWLDDTVVSALAVTELPHLRHRVFQAMAVKAGFNAVAPSSLSVAVNGVYWLALLALPFAAGALCVRAIVRGGFGAVRPLAVLSVFYAQVSLFNQIPIYLYYTVGLSAAGLLSLSAGPRWRRVAPLVLMAMVAVALHSHAAQPPSRGLTGTLEGRRTTNVPCELARCSLRIDPAERQVYAAVLARISAATTPPEPIVAMPNSAELYFLSGRPNPFPFYNTALDVRTDADVEHAVQTISRTRPKVLVYAPGDKYVTRHSDAILRAVAHLYRPPEPLGHFALYVLAE